MVTVYGSLKRWAKSITVSVWGSTVSGVLFNRRHMVFIGLQYSLCVLAKTSLYLSLILHLISQIDLGGIDGNSFGFVSESSYYFFSPTF